MLQLICKHVVNDEIFFYVAGVLLFIVPNND